jgi:solute carrier family 25, member 34/35
VSDPSAVVLLRPSDVVGFYEPFRKQINRIFGAKPTDQIAAASIASGALSGAVGGKLTFMRPVNSLTEVTLASLGNPLFLIKARMQVNGS